MNLKNLVALRNSLAALTVTDIQQASQNQIQKIIYELDRSQVELDSILLNQAQKALNNSFDQFEKELSNLKLNIDQAIKIEEVDWFKQSFEFYKKTLANNDAQRPETVLALRNQPVRLDKETEVLLRSRLVRYSNWRYPGMIIHPMHETFIQDLVSNDPLYLVDESHLLLEPVISQYTELYQRRLRTYTIDESTDHSILASLPDQQFGICFAYNYFNFRPIEIVTQYLTEIYQKLAPGGTLIMTFNNCDRVAGLKLVEQNYSCYTPGRLIFQCAEDIGYDTIFQCDIDAAATWIELQRPGELTSVRGGQALAKIVPN
jgi:hypothetical protein